MGRVQSVSVVLGMLSRQLHTFALLTFSVAVDTIGEMRVLHFDRVEKGISDCGKHGDEEKYVSGKHLLMILTKSVSEHSALAHVMFWSPKHD